MFPKFDISKYIIPDDTIPKDCIVIRDPISGKDIGYIIGIDWGADMEKEKDQFKGSPEFLSLLEKSKKKFI